MDQHPADARPFRLYGAERSYFTGKVRPALRAKRLYFEEVLPTADVYADIRRRTGLLFIPVVVTPEDDTWQDTSDILDALEARFPEPALYPATPVQRIVAYLLELYADEFLILPAMHYRWGTPEGERDARGAFAAVSGRAAGERGADRMAGSLPYIGVTPATAPAIAAHTEELLDELEEVLAIQSFLLGEQPSLGDCALCGPLYAHLYLDLVPGVMLRGRTPRVAHWIERMNHPNPSAFRGFLAGDALADELRPLLDLIGSDAVPFVLDAARAVEAWADTRPPGAAEPPRSVGRHATSLRGVGFQRTSSVYTLYMLQRCLDAYAALDDAGRERVDDALAGTGCTALLRYTPRHRLEKRAFKLVFA